jgi:hypothetical protein
LNFKTVKNEKVYYDDTKMKKSLIVSLLLYIAFIPKLQAVRPFITDDARVVGYRLAQWETWLRFDRMTGQQWHAFAYGPHRRLETTLGAVLGYETSPLHSMHFSYAMPLIQAKFLFREYAHGKGPGVALVSGTFLPGGKGEFVPPGYGAFSFLTVSQCFGENEDVLVHGNVGGNYLYANQNHQWIPTWGLGTQIRTWKGFHVLGEVFSGDPYIPGAGVSWQAGFRHFFSDNLQIDGTVGKGIGGSVILPTWFSLGARLVTHKFEKKKNLPLPA